MIKRLVIKDCLGIEELAINPGKVNVITGGNEKGKTSILESIEKALYNTKRRARFVRAGAEKAYIELETDNGISIRRTVKEDAAGLDTGSVKVTQNDQPVKAPETFLKELFGITAKKSTDTFSFNPVDFMLKKDTEQTDILLSLLPIRVTPEEAQAWFGQAPKVNYEKHGLRVLKDLEQWFYDRRHEENTKVKATEDEIAAIAKRLPDNYDISAWMDVNLGQLFAEVSAAEETNRNIKKQQEFIARYDQDFKDILNKYVVEENKVTAAAEKEIKAVETDINAQKKNIHLQIEAVDAEIEELQRKIQDLQNKRIILKTEANNLEVVSLAERHTAINKVLQDRLRAINEEREKELAKLEQDKKLAEFFIETHVPISIIPLKEKCETAEKMKAYIPLASELKSIEHRLKVEEIEAQHYDKCVETARKKPNELLTTVELPVKDLGIDGRGIVTIKGLPLSNLSTACQLKTCLDIARAMAKDNPLKLICIDKFEHLDTDMREELLKQVEADENYQYFITSVTEGNLEIDTRG